MKSLFLLLAVWSSNVFAKDLFEQIPVDKKLHYSVSFAMQYGFSDMYTRLGSSHPWIWSAVTTLGLGAFKEIFIDQKGDRDDMWANTAGVGSAALFHYTVNF